MPDPSPQDVQQQSNSALDQEFEFWLNQQRGRSNSKQLQDMRAWWYGQPARTQDLLTKVANQAQSKPQANLVAAAQAAQQPDPSAQGTGAIDSPTDLGKLPQPTGLLPGVKPPISDPTSNIVGADGKPVPNTVPSQADIHQAYPSYSDVTLDPQKLSPETAAALSGESMQALHKEYQDYQAHVQAASGGRDSSSGYTGTGISFEDFANQRAANLQGIWRPILDSFSNTYQARTGTQMPPELRLQLLQQLQQVKATTPGADVALRRALMDYQLIANGTDPNTMRPFVAQAGTSSSATQSAGQVQAYQAQVALSQIFKPGVAGGPNIPGSPATGLVPQPIIDTLTNAMDKATLNSASSIETGKNAADQARQNAIIKLFSDYGLSSQLDAATMTNLMKMPIEDATKYVDTHYIYKMGMNHQQWQTAEDSLTKGSFQLGASKGSTWNDLFGTPPSDQQIAAVKGMSGDQIQEWLAKSPSRIKGLTVGQYVPDKMAADQWSTKLFGGPANDELLHRMRAADSGVY